MADGRLVTDFSLPTNWNRLSQSHRDPHQESIWWSIAVLNELSVPKLFLGLFDLSSFPYLIIPLLASKLICYDPLLHMLLS